jgi:hypothetical protein
MTHVLPRSRCERQSCAKCKFIVGDGEAVAALIAQVKMCNSCWRMCTSTLNSSKLRKSAGGYSQLLSYAHEYAKRRYSAIEYGQVPSHGSEAVSTLTPHSSK